MVRSQFSSVQLLSCQTLCNPMVCSMPSLPVHHQLPVYSNSCPLSRWCHPTISSSVVPFSSCKVNKMMYTTYWASLVAQLVKNLPAMQETPVRSLGQEDPLRKEMATDSSTVAWRISWTKCWQATVHGITKAGHDCATFTFIQFITVLSIYMLKDPRIFGLNWIPPN